MGNTCLSSELVWLFRHNGFLKLPGVLSTERVEALRAAILADVAGEVEPVVRNAEGRVVRLSQLLERHSIFRETIGDATALEPLAALLGPNIEVVLNRHNHATLNLAGKTDTFHRDVVQWTRGLVTVIFYLEATTLENGCTQVVPGSHLWPGVSVLHNLQKEAQIDQAGLLQQAVPVPMPAGGMLAIDSLIFHRIGENVTNQSRMSMTVGYHSVDELLDDVQPKRLLVQGERIYMGNDK
ncbi:MAG: phytanoyl-CoA dioxygenase family protein [Candidatus Latescibacteria bacterium]|jgi:phytanoyl-CoA hydroxylase|nr:phytanoyl-CoA dioxygenase family protein [Candidatus Latescibacterota bacterium]MBT5833065.1 phytanoyl-CoA dioxygenase family protein [Candidatus Latescibacterota bacterium]